MKLNSDEKTLLEDIVFSEGIEVVLKVADNIASDIERRINGFSTLDISADKLFVEKARAEGARQLAIGLRRAVEDVKTDRLEALDS